MQESVVELTAHPFDSLMREHGKERMDHVKMDLEGSEDGTIADLIDEVTTIVSNAWLKKIVADRTLDREMFQDVIKRPERRRNEAQRIL